MPFNGTPTVRKLGENAFRITGVSLAEDATATIGFADRTVSADVSLEAPDWQPYLLPYESPPQVNLTDFVQVLVLSSTAPVQPITVSKTGADHGDFVITLHNENMLQATGDLEIMISRSM